MKRKTWGNSEYMSNLTPRIDYFEIITGINEKELINNYFYNREKYEYMMREIIEKENGKYYIKQGDKRYKCGDFEMISLGELREKTRNKEKIGGGKFNVEMGMDTNFNSIYRDKVDIGALQSKKENRQAVFQIASNFNGLEPSCKQDYPEEGITKYIYDKTQGPFGSISAAPGLIHRSYSIFHNNKKSPLDWRQTKFKQINFLQDVLDYYPTTNGYIDLNKSQLKSPISDIVNKIKIGFHENIQVTFGMTYPQELHETIDDPNQLIHQVFTSTIDLGTVSGSTNYRLLQQNPSIVLQLNQHLLDASYESIIRLAWLKNYKKVYLTLIGGGVFQNSFSLLAQSLEKLSSLIVDSGLNVTLIIYSYRSLVTQNQQLAKSFIQRIQDLTITTDGNFNFYQ